MGAVGPRQAGGAVGAVGALGALGAVERAAAGTEQAVAGGGSAQGAVRAAVPQILQLLGLENRKR